MDEFLNHPLLTFTVFLVVMWLLKKIMVDGRGH